MEGREKQIQGRLVLESKLWYQRERYQEQRPIHREDENQEIK